MTDDLELVPDDELDPDAKDGEPEPPEPRTDPVPDETDEENDK